MVPAQQCLHSGHPTGGQRDRRLILEEELFFRDGGVKLHVESVPIIEILLHPIRVDGKPELACCFGVIERDVSLLQ